MGLASQIFQKNLNELVLQDLIDFFETERHETANLEFKSGKTALEGIIREVCAFLNTDGGVIVYGAPKEIISKTGVKACLGELTPTDNFKSKLALGSSIASNILPAPSGINIHQIEMDGSLIFILDVPKSVHAPHQFSNQGKYYIRMDTESRPAPHGLVEALFFKRQKPNLDLVVAVNYKYTHVDVVELKFDIWNDADYTAENIGHIFKIYGVKNFDFMSIDKEYTVIENKNTVSVQNTRVKTILVKGISYITDIVFEPIQTTQIIIHALIWCKDISAREYYFTLDSLNSREVIEIYDSKFNDEKPDLEKLLKPFQ